MQGGGGGGGGGVRGVLTPPLAPVVCFVLFFFCSLACQREVGHVQGYPFPVSGKLGN